MGHSEDHAGDLVGTLPPYRVRVLRGFALWESALAYESFDDAHDEQLAALVEWVGCPVQVVDARGRVIIESVARRVTSSN